MAQIPYGYRIEKGNIVTDTEAAAKIDRFVKCYLSGLSVKESKKASEISLITDTEEEDGSLSYVLTVTNRIRKTVRFLKVDLTASTPLFGAVFDLYKVTGGTREEEPMFSGLVSGEDGIVTNGGNADFILPVGTYQLVETAPPEGYQGKREPVVIEVLATPGKRGIRYDEGTSLSYNGGITYDEKTKIYTLRISNSEGYELPSTGGIGTGALRCASSALMIMAAFLLLLRKMKKIRCEEAASA